MIEIRHKETGANLQSSTYSFFLRTGMASGSGVTCNFSIVWLLLPGVIGMATGLSLWVLGIALLLSPLACIAMAAWGILRTRLDGADLRGATLPGAHLADAVLRGADLRESNLEGTVLTQTDFTRADLRGANLTDAELKMTCFLGADLRDARFSNPDLRGVQYDASTRWTDGFDLEACGARPMRLVDYRNLGGRGRAAEVSPATRSEGSGDEPNPSSHGHQDGTGEG
jgi:uncharacterized protein YjbI with pentapeptide repeats